MKTYYDMKKPKYLVLRARVFLVCLLIPLFANATDYPTADLPPADTILDERSDYSSFPPPDYSWPPRCGPRNCVAMCVTCGYDICRSSGGSVEQCKLQMEQCKQSCIESELEDCPPSDPFCDFNRHR